MVAEEATAGERDGLYPVANTELREQASQLRLDGVLTHVEVRGQLAVRHSRRQHGEQLALSFRQPSLSAWPSKLLWHPCVLRTVGQHDRLAAAGGPDAVDDLGRRDCFRDEPSGAGAQKG